MVDAAPLIILLALAAVVWRLFRASRRDDASIAAQNHTDNKPALHATEIRDRKHHQAHHGILRGKAYVIDGDTIVVQKQKIRLAGIDAPEIDKPWGNKAKWAMVQICKGQTLSVHLTGEVSFDRLVGTAYLPDGRDISAEIVKRGLALDLPQFSGGKYKALEPEGARKRLRNGLYGHSSLRWKNKAPR